MELSSSLSTQELEQAMEVVDLAWLEAQGSDVELRVPKALYHLTMDQWEEVCQILMLLQYQQETSVIH